MSKSILILDNSITIQKLFTKTLDSSQYDLKFVSEGKDFIYKLFDYTPDIVLINAEIEEPSSYELVKLIRAIPCFKGLPIGMYASNDVPFDEYLAERSGANIFVRLDEKTLTLNIEELSQIFNSGSVNKTEVVVAKNEFNDSSLLMLTMKVWDKDTIKNLIFKTIYDLQKDISDIKTVVVKFLSLIAEVCEVPIVSLYMIENDGPHAYSISAPNFKQEEKDDFYKVCLSDFENIAQGVSIASMLPEPLEAEIDLSKFYTQSVQLSSYETTNLEKTDSTPFGSVHMVCEGNFTLTQISLFQYACSTASLIFENCILLKTKVFYEQRSRRAFSRFVPEEIIDDLVNRVDSEKVSVGEKRAVAIMFSDIRSFTSISEKNKPEVIVAFLNRYFTIMVDIIKKHGGTIDKFIGDAIMALFGTPVSYEDNAKRAVAAGYEMREALANIPLEDLVMPEGMSFNIGIGIHYGDVIVGSIGSKDKTDYSVIGDSVNLASRLEGLTKTYGCQLLVSEGVKEDIGEGEFVFRHLDNVKVKGKKIAVPIYAIDRSQDEFPATYRDAYSKGMGLYTQGIFNLAKEYFEKALTYVEHDKAAELMLSRCKEFIENPPENWDGAIAFNTK